jgi:hypothetical protein
VVYRVLGFVTGFALAVLGGWLLLQAARPRPPHALCESGAGIATVEIQYTTNAAALTWPVLSAFFDQLDPKVEVIAACGNEADEAALRRVWKWPQALQTVTLNAAITGWSKDRFLVTGEKPARLLCPRPDPNPIPGRNNDPLVASALAKRWPGRFVVDYQPLAFDAGDILCTDTTAIFSDSLAAKNGRPPDLDRQVAQMTGLKPLWLRGVPDHHIGMFAAPLDDRTVVVGDPDLGLSLSKPQEALTSSADLQPFRNAISEFEKAGFKVVKAPILVFAPKVYATYTNAVLEHQGSRKIVYMPVYGIPRLDEAGAAAYRSQGWEVKPIPVGSVYRLRGTIGCLVNVLQRKQ